MSSTDTPERLMLQDTDQMLLPAVKATIAALEGKTDADTALIRLAEKYAAEIDASQAGKRLYALKHLGPLLHDALESLGATPVARAKDRSKGTGAPGATGKLAQLRAAHRAS